MDMNEALEKCKQHATELVANVRQSIKTFNIAIQEIDTSRKTLDSMFAATKEKISKKADEEIATVVARIREEKQKLMQEAKQIYKDRVQTLETERTTNSKEMNKAEHKQDEVNQLIMDREIKSVHHIKQLLQYLKEYREIKSTKLPDGLTYMDFKEGQKSLGRLVLNDEQQVEPATSAQARKRTVQSMKHFKLDKWTLKTNINQYKNIKQQMVKIFAKDVVAYSNSDIVVLDRERTSLIIISAVSNPQPTVIAQAQSINSLTVSKNDELVVLHNEGVKIFKRNYQLLYQFNPIRWSDGKPSCIAVDDNNLIAVGYDKAEISLHKPDGSHFRTQPAPGIGDYLTTYKEQLIYTDLTNRKLVSILYNGVVVFSVDTYQSELPHGVCCDKDGSIYVAARRVLFPSSGGIHHYSPDGKYIGCIIKGCVDPRGITLTPAGDLVVATKDSVQIYQH